MKNKESTQLATTKQNDHPEWHPFSVWQREIRSHQAHSVVQTDSQTSEAIEQTAVWKMNVKNV